MAPTKIHEYPTMSYHYQHNNANTTRKPNRGSNLFKMNSIDRKINRTGIISLLEASPVAKKAQWELRSFLRVENNLHPKRKSYPVTAFISVLGRHFDN